MAETATANFKPEQEENQLPKKYTRTKLLLSFVEYGLTLAYFLFLVFGGGSLWFGRLAESVVPHTYGKLILFILLIGLGNGLLTWPIGFYSGFVLEHRYGLSNQNFLQWLREEIKGLLISLVILLPLLLIFYFFLRLWPVWWWVPVGLIFFFFSVVLAKLAPLLIFPLFYKFSPIEDEALKTRILSLCEKVGVRVQEILSFNLSKTTQKANAAFAGLGKTKRILISYTLLDHFSPDEIEVVFAHELGHTHFGHIRKGLVTGFVTIFLSLFGAAWAFRATYSVLGYARATQIEALPLLFLFLMLFGLLFMPIQNAISRHFERQADRFALEITGKPEVFISAMEKLARLNLSDRQPNPVVEFLFYSHPSIQKRVAAARSFALEGAKKVSAPA